ASFFMGNGAMVGMVAAEGLLPHPVAVFKFKGNLRSTHRFQFFPVTVVGQAVLIHYLLNKLVHDIGICGSMHPPCFFIKSLIDEKLAPGYGTIGIQPFLADGMYFAPEIKGSMRINQQHGISRLSQAAGYCYS